MYKSRSIFDRKRSTYTPANTVLEITTGSIKLFLVTPKLGVNKNITFLQIASKVKKENNFFCHFFESGFQAILNTNFIAFINILKSQKIS